MSRYRNEEEQAGYDDRREAGRWAREPLERDHDYRSGWTERDREERRDRDRREEERMEEEARMHEEERRHREEAELQRAEEERQQDP